MVFDPIQAGVGVAPKGLVAIGDDEFIQSTPVEGIVPKAGAAPKEGVAKLNCGVVSNTLVFTVVPIHEGVVVVYVFSRP